MATNKTITQRIALEGGADIRKQLDDIGTAGKAAFDKLAAASAASDGLVKLGSTVEVLASRFNNFKDAASNVGQSFNNFTGSVGTVVTRVTLLGAAAGAAVAGFSALIKSSGETQEALQNTADTLGTTVEKWRAFSDAAELAGVAPQTVEKGLLKLNAAMNASRDATGAFSKQAQALADKLKAGTINQNQYGAEMAKLKSQTSGTGDVFKKLGVSVTNADGSLRDVTTVAKEVGVRLNGIDSAADQASLSMQAFGTRNAKFGTFVRTSAEDMAKLEAEARRIAPALDKAGRDALDAASDSFTTLGKAANATKEQVLAVFAPDVTRLVKAYTESVVANRAGWVNLAKTIESQVRPVVNDIAALLEGRDQDVKNSFVLTLRDQFVQFGKDAKAAITDVIIPALGAMLVVLQEVADVFNALFGTKLTGGQLAIVAVLTKVIGLFGVFASAGKLAYSVIVLIVSGMGTLTASIGVVIRAVTLVASTLIGAFGAVPIAIAAVGLAIGFLVVTIVQKLGGVQAIIDAIGAAFTSLGTLIGEVVSTIAQGFQDGFNGLVSLAQTAINQIVAFFVGLPQTLAGVWVAVVALATNAWTAIVTSVTALAAALITAFNVVVTSIASVFATLPAALTTVWTTITTLFQTIWTAVITGASSAVESVVSYFTQGLQTVTNAFGALGEYVNGIFAAIIAGAKAVAAAVAAATGSGDGGDSPGFARGGHVRGPGSGTSDSILARLSDGEFVMKAAAVRKWGVGFMQSLNNLRTPAQGFSAGGLVQRVTHGLDGIPRFRDGGLATAAAAAGNGGGSSGRPLTLVIDGQQIEGMSAGEAAVDQLSRIAARRQMRSSGRKPLWFKGK